MRPLLTVVFGLALTVTAALPRAEDPARYDECYSLAPVFHNPCTGDEVRATVEVCSRYQWVADPNGGYQLQCSHEVKGTGVDMSGTAYAIDEAYKATLNERAFDPSTKEAAVPGRLNLLSKDAKKSFAVKVVFHVSVAGGVAKSRVEFFPEKCPGE